MKTGIGIRREDKNRWERRAPLTPPDVADLIRQTGLEVCVQSSPIRVFNDEEYARAGATLSESLDDCSVVFGIKEMPVGFFRRSGTYVFFSHTHKGQEQNMPMLREMMELGCQLIDYERITHEDGRRLLFFGRFAGLAGMIDGLWALGRRLSAEGHQTPLARIKMAHEYASLEDAKAAISDVASEIRASGSAPDVTPLVVGVAGYGHVSQGAQEILDLLPVLELTPEQLLTHAADSVADRVVKVVFKEEHTVRRRGAGGAFNLDEFFAHPELYEGRFRDYMPHLTMLVNAIYWDERYPRLVTKADVGHFCGEDGASPLRVIADISCDIEGAIECTVKATDPDAPTYVFDPDTGAVADGFRGRGPVIVAVDNLPCELPRESSEYFSTKLKPYVPTIVAADFTGDLQRCGLPTEVQRALILHRGELTPPYEFMRRFVAE